MRREYWNCGFHLSGDEEEGTDILRSQKMRDSM
jgi:hypothetical protein